MPALPTAAPTPATDTREAVSALLARHGHAAHALVQILREVQAQLGWLPRHSLAAGGRRAGLEPGPGARAWPASIASSHLQPVGRYRVLFSDNITDRLLGSEKLMADLCRRLGVAPGRMSQDGLVSVDRSSCTGLATRARRCWSTTTTWSRA